MKMTVRKTKRAGQIRDVIISLINSSTIMATVHHYYLIGLFFNIVLLLVVHMRRAHLAECIKMHPKRRDELQKY